MTSPNRVMNHTGQVCSYVWKLWPSGSRLFTADLITVYMAAPVSLKSLMNGAVVKCSIDGHSGPPTTNWQDKICLINGRKHVSIESLGPCLNIRQWSRVWSQFLNRTAVSLFPVTYSSLCLQMKARPGPIPAWLTISADNRDSDNHSLELSRPRYPCVIKMIPLHKTQPSRLLPLPKQTC